MKSKKHKLSAIVFYSVIIALALVSPNVAFGGDFRYTVSGGTVTITGGKYICGMAVTCDEFGGREPLEIPAEIDGMPVVGIGVHAFELCCLPSVTIPDSVTSIGDYAFGWNYSLTKAYFLGNAPAMGAGVFGNCASNFSICYTAGSTGFTNPWYGYPAAVCENTLIELSSFAATPKSGKVILQWSTETETDNAGFNLYRATSENGKYVKINDALIPAEGSPTQGASYEYVDIAVQNGKKYWYKLQDVDVNGTTADHGPVKVKLRKKLK